MNKLILLILSYTIIGYSKPLIIAHKGFSNLHPQHTWGCYRYELIDKQAPPEFTTQGIQMAFRYGADMVEVDTRLTKDGRIVLILNENLDCYTNLNGKLKDYTLSELKAQLDPGFQISFDQGETFPLRGKFKGDILTLEELYQKFPKKSFLINPKDRNQREIDSYKKFFKENGPKKIYIWGPRQFYDEISKVNSETGIFINNHIQSKSCLNNYKWFGWLGIFPKECINTTLSISDKQTRFLWKWPVGFNSLMKKNGTKVFYFLPEVKTENLKKIKRVLQSDIYGVITADIKEFHQHFHNLL